MPGKPKSFAGKHRAPPKPQVKSAIPPGWSSALLDPDASLRALANKARYMPLRRADGARGAVYEDTPNARATVTRLIESHPKAAELLFLAPRGHVHALWADHLAPDLTQFSQTHLATTQPEMSARETLARRQTLALVAISLCLAFWALLAAPSLVVVLNLLFGCLYFTVGAARILAALSPVPRRVRYSPLAHRMAKADLPIYSVLVPIYDEAAMVPQLIASLRALDYPPDKLEIFLLAEADDQATLQALSRQNLPGHMAVIRVPPSEPRTKPKALNYALPLTRGAFLTIYDAEDRPEPDQLRKAVAAFSKDRGGGGAKLGCVQAALNVTNGRKTFLSRHFALEYMALFDVFLPALSRLDLPIPLGGTSNHFRRTALIKAGGWDPYNVTEDADLGIRLARLGYTTQMINSTTYEEAPTRFGPWIKQRARWFKGWWQTWLVHMRHPLRLMRELGAPGFFTFQTIMLGVLISVLIHPFFLLMTLWAMSGVGGPLYAAASGTGQVLITFNLGNFIIGYLATAMLSGAGADRRGVKHILPVLLTIPLYWVCLSAAGFLALWELIRRPHHWNKTPHGVG
ncbi:MAG: glycosyltransferase [Rhizobiales bacterium]|nr:glycosyltransferase [Hyphomicrobiales bacterium]MBO6699282.1 glycosyltransferase [Hyphomicrobiales bacterium]MBO6736820.1 glycosyltransferase [Hyphomicrobiales bacterium]MBO6912106.1 glycosyltransferase [Hyphomicrobiales bacterium]MBO6954526.1 glycosyltransferase [Hyphomicrobiales bacterium]